MTPKTSMVSTVLLALAILTLAGCDAYTCEGACGQYYLADGCARPSILANDTSPEAAHRNCSKECTDAMYTTTESPGGTDNSNYAVLESQSDAESFINCVAEQDYSEAAFNATCADLDYSCPWFRW